MHSQVTPCDNSPIATRYTFAWRRERVAPTCFQCIVTGSALLAGPWWAVVVHIQDGSMQVSLRDPGRGYVNPSPVTGMAALPPALPSVPDILAPP